MENLKNTLLLTDKRVLKTAVAAVLISKAVDNISHNKDFYVDVAKFNTKSYKKKNESYGLDTGCLDPEVRRFLDSVYEELNLSYEKIFERLNLISTFSTKYTPLEVKFVEEYIKKYGSTYDRKNKITEKELLHPLTNLERDKVRKKFA